MEARQGRKVPHNVYVTDPSWTADRLVGQQQSPEAAAAVVAGLQAVWNGTHPPEQDNAWVFTLPEVPRVD